MPEVSAVDPAGVGAPPPRPARPAHHRLHPRVVPLGGRVIRLGTMDFRLRVVVMVVVLQGAIVAALIALQGRGLEYQDVTTVSGHLASMPIPVFWAAVVFSIVAWTYVLAGAIHGHLLLRPLALGLFTWSMLSLVFIAGQAGGSAYSLATRACFFGLWALAGGAWAHDLWRTRTGAGHLTHRHRLRIPTVALVMTLVSGTILLPYLGTTSVRAPLLYREGFFNSVFALADFFVPMLLLTAIDLTEVGLVVIERTTRAAQRVSAPFGTAVALLVSALAVLAVDRPGSTARGLAYSVGFGVALALFGVLLVAGGRRALSAAHRIPYSAIAVSAVLVFALPFALSAYLATRVLAPTAPSAGGVVLTWFTQDQAPQFSIQYPQSWRISADAPNPTALQAIAFSGIDTGIAAQAVVLTTPETTSSTAADEAKGAVGLLSGGGDVQLGSPERLGEWTVLPFEVTPQGTTGKLAGRAYGRIGEGRVWVLVAYGSRPALDVFTTAFDAMARSWSPKGHPAAATTRDAEPRGYTVAIDRSVGAIGVLSLAVAITCVLGLLVAGRWGRWGGDRVPRRLLPAGLLYLGFWALLEAATRLPYVVRLAGELLHVPALATANPPGFGDYATRDGVAVLSLGLLVYGLVRGRGNPAWRGVLGLLAVLNLGLLMLRGLYYGYGAEMDATGKFSLLAALMVLAALAWDVVLSGESITNRHGDWFPRHTRVMLFMGYEMLVSTSVLFLSALHFQFGGGQVQALFTTDVYPQSGMYELAVPFLLSLVALRLAASGRAEDSDPAQEPPEAAGAGDRAAGNQGDGQGLAAHVDLEPAGT